MLTITVPAVDEWDDDAQQFISADEAVLELEHSLISLSKWESKWEKPFLSHTEHSDEEALSYIKMMTLTPDVPSEVYQRLTNGNLKQINDYINAKMSATWFNERAKTGPASREIITSEVIYHWMYTAQIAQECEMWHLNRLFTLIKVFNEKNDPKGKKMNKREALSQQRSLNAQRKAQMGSNG